MRLAAYVQYDQSLCSGRLEVCVGSVAGGRAPNIEVRGGPIETTAVTHSTPAGPSDVGFPEQLEPGSTLGPEPSFSHAVHFLRSWDDRREPQPRAPHDALITPPPVCPRTQVLPPPAPKRWARSRFERGIPAPPEPLGPFPGAPQTSPEGPAACRGVSGSEGHDGQRRAGPRGRVGKARPAGVVILITTSCRPPRPPPSPAISRTLCPHLASTPGTRKQPRGSRGFSQHPPVRETSHALALRCQVEAGPVPGTGAVFPEETGSPGDPALPDAKQPRPDLPQIQAHGLPAPPGSPEPTKPTGPEPAIHPGAAGPGPPVDGKGAPGHPGLPTRPVKVSSP
ncbi:proline-rich protein 2-like [Perognathus longimembris pacificus]|uniref:proline-rich protein 2-like n=1 Tax=Perognathus longimembris pacificus TaxID=214514 RepID=UPI00201A1021|nr:proline-rich protein 2-like [Perognathus longimembris pacificus]